MALFVITGLPASGKSTVAQLLAQRRDRAVYVSGDTLRTMVVGGEPDSDPDIGDAVLHSLLLRYQAAMSLAGIYLNAGFDVIVEDVIIGQVLRQFLALVPVPEMHLVFLNPDADTVTKRDADRAKTAYGERWNVRQLRDVLSLETAKIGLWLDSTDQSPEETVAAILADLNASRIMPSRLSSPVARRRRRFGPPR